MIILNSLICLLIVARIMLYERHNSQHRPLINWLAYMLTVAAGIEAIMGLMGIASYPSFSTVLFNLVLCAALFCVRGNVAELFKSSDESYCYLARLLRWHPKSHNKPRKV